MERYANVLLIAIPIFSLLILLEKLYSCSKGVDMTPNMDAISSLSSGITNIVKDVLKLTFVIFPYQLMLKHLAFFQLQSSVLMYVIAFFILDFQGYWTHRWAHEINFFWNKHAIHHSSEEFNLACALRQTLSSFVNIFTFFLLPAAVLGIPKEVIMVVAPLHLFAQFWYHTRLIDKMGFLEKIIVTPSHHRVHHAINSEYLDKNYGQILIIWDKIFGTFQEELVNVPPVYGITVPVATWNPIKINFQHLSLLIQDAWRTKNWQDKFRIWFMPTGWRPTDTAAQFPLSKISDIYQRQKYNPPASTALISWSYFQLFSLLTFIAFFFSHFLQIGVPNIYLYGFWVLLTVYSYTELMDLNPYAIIWEGIRFLFSVGLMLYMGDWFGLTQLIPFGNYLIISFFIFSFMGTIYFAIFEKKKIEVLMS